MTEKEAKTKRCCGPAGCGTHRKGANGKEYRGCNASACMGWRWVDVSNPEYQRHAQSGLAMWPAAAAPTMYVKSDTDGYCGIAGRP